MYYFAYGSNMNPERIKARLENHLPTSISVKLFGYELVFNKASNKDSQTGFANISPNPAKVVEGVIFEIDANELKLLDNKEGYPDHYNRITVNVMDNTLNKYEAITYIANENKILNNLKIKKDYMNHLLAGKEYLSDSYYEWLKTIPIID